MKVFSNSSGVEGFLLSIVFALFLASPTFASHGHSHQHFHQQREVTNHSRYTAPEYPPNSNTSTLTPAEEIIAKALDALAVANAVRLKHPRFNTYEFKNATTNATSEFVPLDYNSTLPILERRAAGGNLTHPYNGTLEQDNGRQPSYYLPQEVIDAAKIVAEITPPEPTDPEILELAAKGRAMMAERYSGQNDTNAMPQALLRDDGLGEYVLQDDFLSIVPRMASTVPNGTTLAKRADPSFWMASIAQYGKSPFALSGYKVSS
jgi:hypothetical protein